MKRAGAQLVAEARALLAAYPDAAALQTLPICALPDGGGPAALRHLRAEMVLVRDGTAGGVVVLADEIANAERELAAG